MAPRSISYGKQPRASTLLACGLLLCACGAAPSERQPAPGAAAASPGRPVLLVGLDGADWLAIDPLVTGGKLPTFARIKASGRTGTLLATPPLLSPILWTTIATGRHPEDHGVLDFMIDLPSGGQAPVGSTTRRVPALWNLFSDAGRRVAVVGWWATWPAEAVRGTIVSDRVAPQLARTEASLDDHAISPKSEVPGLSSLLVRASEISAEDLRGYVPLTQREYDAARVVLRAPGSRLYNDPIAHLAAVIAGTRTYSRMAEAILASGQPDLLAVYLEGIDTVSHRFVRDPRGGSPAIERAYRDADDLLARLVARAASDTLIIVCSDHGFQPADAGIAVDPADLAGPATAWHRPYGIIAVAEAGALSGRASARLAPGPLGTLTPLDVAPTVLHAAGLPVGLEMPGRVATQMLPEDVARRPVTRAPTAERPPASEPSAGPLDADLRARLQALGYIGAATTSLARQNLGEILYRGGKLAAAERELRAVVAAQQENLTARLWLAKTLRDQARAREALKVYESALQLPGGASEALVAAVEVAVSAGLREEALRILTGLKGSAPTVAVNTARAILAQADGRPREAEAELKAALAEDPASFDALSRLLDLLLPARRAREALPYVRRAARRVPGSPRHLALFGETLLAAGDAAGAERELRRALALAPDAGSVGVDLARAQLVQGKAAEAQATLEPAPSSTERSIVLGAAYSAQGRWTEAAAQLESALRDGPATPELLNGLGWAQFKLGRNTQAAELLRRSLALNDKQPAIRRLLAQVEQAAVR